MSHDPETPRSPANERLLSGTQQVMSPAEVLAYLDASPADVGFVATTLRDGDPVVVPVWYRYDGVRVTIWTTGLRAWARRVTVTGRAAFSVADDAAPFAGVTLRGPARLVDGDRPDLLAEVRRITARYVDASAVDAYVASWWPDLQAIVSIEPETIRGWSAAG